jgi:hypothetical protein
MMISKILVIASATRDAAVSILDAFQIIQKGRPSVKIIFASYLCDLFKKRLGPNTLNHWMKEEKEGLEMVKNYFSRMDIPYDFKVITVPPWEMVFNEIKDGVHDLIILHGEALKMWRKERTICGLCSETIYSSNCPILVINQSEGDSLSFEHLNSDIS